MRKSWQAARPARFGNSVFAGLGPAPASGWRPLSSFRGTGRFLAKQLELEALPSKEYVVMIFWAAASAFFLYVFWFQFRGRILTTRSWDAWYAYNRGVLQNLTPKTGPRMYFFRPARLRFFFCGCVWFQHFICRVHGMFFCKHSLHVAMPCVPTLFNKHVVVCMSI